MFGIGFTELLLIAVIAILFLGPDKLPEAMVQMAKFIRSVKNTIGEAKHSLEEEMKIGELKEEALNYKQKLDATTQELKGFKNIDFDSMEHLLEERPSQATPTHYAQAQTPPPKVETSAPKETIDFKKSQQPFTEEK
jgi:sec-independent protein translocase protein TatB